MDALWLFVYTVGAFGLAYIVGHSEITRDFRTSWAETHRALDVFRCNVCIAENALDSPLSFEWARYKLPIEKGAVVCPNGGPAHAVGLKVDLAAPDPFLLRLIECPACFGFWFGVLMLIAAFIGLAFPTPIILLLPFYTCGANYLLGRATGLIPNPSKE